MQIIINILYSFFIFLILSKSFEIIYRVMGFFHMAHAASLTLAAYLVYTCSIIWSLPFLLSVLLSIVFVVFFLVLINQYIYVPGRKYCLEGWKLMIISLGIYVIIQNVISMIWGDSTLTFRTWAIKQGHSIWGGVITDVQIISITTSLLLLLCVWWLNEKTMIGRSLKAVSLNPSLSSILGIRKSLVSFYSIAIGSALMACAGILIASDVDMTPTMGFDWLLYGVVAMIIAGTGKTRYLVFASLLLATAQHLSAYFLDSKWMNATAYVILIIFLYFRPYGFSGQKIKKTEV